jgi:hypothetical protein
MARLKKEMYYRERGRRPSGLFGLLNGQLSGRRVRAAKNAGWYNRDGEKLGWGDLSFDDIVRIRDGLRPGELFITLGERDSFWAFVTRLGGPVGAMHRVRRKERAPGVRYVIDHCSFIIAPGKLYLVSRYPETRKTWRPRGLRFRIIDLDAARALVKDARTH